MSRRIKVRGIYSTALTKFALDAGFQVVEPSEKIRGRFRTHFPDNGWYEILISDREDRQGVQIRGEADHLCELLALLQGALLDAVIVSITPSEDSDPAVIANLELPGGAKEKLDRIRAEVVPTLRNHHRLKIINQDLLQSAEEELSRHPGESVELERAVVREAILEPLIRDGNVRLEHIRPSGKAMRPRRGVLQSAADDRIVFKRNFSQGRYDGLDLPIREGDYCLTEIRDGEWYVRHRYFSGNGEPIGEYLNVNTPTELYPYGARYMDLEVDVIRRAGEKAFIIDMEKLDILARKGCIGKGLRDMAVGVAERMLLGLNS